MVKRFTKILIKMLNLILEFLSLVKETVRAYAYYFRLSFLFNLAPWLCTYLLITKTYKKKYKKDLQSRILVSFHPEPRQHHIYAAKCSSMCHLGEGVEFQNTLYM